MKTSSQRCSGGALCCLPENSASRASHSCSRIHLSSRYGCAAVLCLPYLCVVFTLLSSYLPGVPMQPAAVLVVCHPHEVPAFPGTPVRSRSASRVRWPAHSLTPSALHQVPGWFFLGCISGKAVGGEPCLHQAVYSNQEPSKQEPSKQEPFHQEPVPNPWPQISSVAPEAWAA